MVEPVDRFLEFVAVFINLFVKGKGNYILCFNGGRVVARESSETGHPDKDEYRTVVVPRVSLANDTLGTTVDTHPFVGSASRCHCSLWPRRDIVAGKGI